jgi:hypothetical protein
MYSLLKPSARFVPTIQAPFRGCVNRIEGKWTCGEARSEPAPNEE